MIPRFIAAYREGEDPIRVVFEGRDTPLSAEFSVTINLLHFREETEGQFHAAYASFSHTPDDVVEMERVLGCPVHTGASWNGWALARETWALPLRRRDPVLGGLLSDAWQRQAPLISSCSIMRVGTPPSAIWRIRCCRLARSPICLAIQSPPPSTEHSGDGIAKRPRRFATGNDESALECTHRLPLRFDKLAGTQGHHPCCRRSFARDAQGTRRRTRY